MAKRTRNFQYLSLSKCGYIYDGNGNPTAIDVELSHKIIGKFRLNDFDILTILDTFRPLPKRYAVMHSVTLDVVQCFPTNEEAQKHKCTCGTMYIVKDLLADSEKVVSVEPAAVHVED